MKTLRLFFSIIFIGFLFEGNAQDNWIQYDTSDGLVDDRITKVVIENETNIWIATWAGLSHFDGTTFTNYTTQNSSLANDTIVDLELGKNEIWLQTNSGLTSFDGTTFRNFNTSNGLISNELTDIATTSDGTVWAASLNGVVRYDGTQFIHDSSKVAHAIEADSNDRVYILKQILVAGFLDSTNYEIFDGTSWSFPSVGSFTGTYQAKFFKSEDGQLLLAGGNNTSGYAEIKYPFDVDEYPLTSEFSSNSVFPFQIFKSGDRVFVTNSGDDFFLNFTKDSILRPFIVSTSEAYYTSIVARSIDISNNFMVVGTVQHGIFLVDKSIEPVDRITTFELNQIRTVVRDHGPLFTDLYRVRPNFEFPKDSSSHGIFSSDFVVVAKQARQSGFQINAVRPFQRNNNPGPISDAAGYSKSYMAKVSRREINQHRTNFNQPSYSMPSGIANWPAVADSTVNMPTDLAPFFDANNNGCYDPENGDYPIIKGDEAVYWINHNSDSNLKLEYHYMLYGYNRPNDTALNQSVFLQYRLINRSAKDYDSVKVGLFVDGDLGNSADDYVGCDSIHNIGYVYNGDLFDEAVQGFNGYKANPPALGVKFLSDSMTSFSFFNLGTSANGDPQTAADWNNLFNGRWKDGTPFKYGGDGFNSPHVTNQTTTHMFTGTPFPTSGWTERSPDLNPNSNNSNSPGDRRFVASIPNFALNAGQSKTIEVVFGYGRKAIDTADLGENVPEMIRVLNHAKTIWDTISQPKITFASNHNCFVAPVGIEEHLIEEDGLSIYPNPSNGQVFVESNEGIQSIQLFSMNGQLIRNQTLNNLKNFSLDLSSLNEGLYFMRLQTAKGDWKVKKLILSR